jgi:hypothetical protein
VNIHEVPLSGVEEAANVARCRETVSVGFRSNITIPRCRTGPGTNSVLLDHGDAPGYSAHHLTRMLHMAMTDLDVGTGHARPAQRSPDTKAAIDYLIASGATAITITEHDGVCVIPHRAKDRPARRLGAMAF